MCFRPASLIVIVGILIVGRIVVILPVLRQFDFPAFLAAYGTNRPLIDFRILENRITILYIYSGTTIDALEFPAKNVTYDPHFDSPAYVLSSFRTIRPPCLASVLASNGGLMCTGRYPYYAV
jgi:hypothetical protein